MIAPLFDPLDFDPGDAELFDAMLEADDGPYCRVCGCTQNRACVDEVGNTCIWAAPDLCSFCARKGYV